MDLSYCPPKNEKMEALIRTRALDAMRRAAKKKLPVDKSFVEDSLLSVRQAGYRCSISGHPFDLEYKTAGAGGTHFAPSPDKIDPQLGYVRGNVRWVLWCFNRGKGEMSADRFLEACRLVGSYNPTATTTAYNANQHSIAYITTTSDVKVSDQKLRKPKIAAYKAHVTMARKACIRLTGDRLAVALRKVAQQEARLAEALALVAS